MPGPIGPNDVRPSGLVIHQTERGFVSQIVVRGELVDVCNDSEASVELEMQARLAAKATALGVLPRLTSDRTIQTLRERLG